MPDATYRLNGAPKPPHRRFADLDGPDFFPTPAWATLALLGAERFEGMIWECAAGDGSMAEVLRQAGHRVRASDLHDRGHGETGVDFLAVTEPTDNIVTNPPYNAAEAFVHQGLRLARRKLALLLRLAFLEGVNRQRTLFAATPPARVHVFSERITFYPKGMARRGGGTTAYAWFVWDAAAGRGTELRWIPPGRRAPADGATEPAAERPPAGGRST